MYTFDTEPQLYVFKYVIFENKKLKFSPAGELLFEVEIVAAHTKSQGC